MIKNQIDLLLARMSLYSHYTPEYYYVEVKCL